MNHGNCYSGEEETRAGAQKVKSIHSNDSVVIDIVNETDKQLACYWLSFDGEKVHYFDLYPNDTVAGMSTFCTHPWLMEYKDKPVCLFTITDESTPEGTQIKISQNDDGVFEVRDNDGAQDEEIRSTSDQIEEIYGDEEYDEEINDGDCELACWEGYRIKDSGAKPIEF